MDSNAGFLTEDARELRTVLRRFIDQHMPKDAAERWDHDNVFPRDVFERLAALGVIGLTIPEKNGGAGRDIRATMMVIEELSKRSMAIAIPYIMAACYAGMTLLECGSEEQKAELLPRVAAGDLLFAYGWTEPEVGADLASVTTSARVEGDEIVINGAKRFCTGAGVCDYIYTLVRSDPAGPRYQNLSLVMIPPTADGVTVEGVHSLGLKGASTTDVTFDEVRVPFDHLVGGPEGWNRGWSMITGVGLDVEKLEVAAMALGLAQGAFEEAEAYAETRQQFGKPIGEFQAVRHGLADMRTTLYAARLVLEDAATRADRREQCGTETSMAKLFVTEAAKTVVLEAQNIMGAYGYVRGFDCERYVRDVLAMPIIGGSSAVQRNNIAKWRREATTPGVRAS